MLPQPGSAEAMGSKASGSVRCRHSYLPRLEEPGGWQRFERACLLLSCEADSLPISGIKLEGPRTTYLAIRTPNGESLRRILTEL